MIYKKKTQDGSNIIEMALVLPIFLLLLFGVLYFGMYFVTRQTAQIVAEQVVSGAVSINAEKADVDRAINRQLNNRLSSIDVPFPGSFDKFGAPESEGKDGRCGGNAAGSYVCVTPLAPARSYRVTVRLSLPFSQAWPGFPDLIGFLTGGEGASSYIEGNASAVVDGVN